MKHIYAGTEQPLLIYLHSNTEVLREVSILSDGYQQLPKERERKTKNSSRMGVPDPLINIFTIKTKPRNMKRKIRKQH